jgi:hypothetical protein
MTVAVRTEHGAAEIQALAKAAVTPEQARRLLAIALVLEGASREDAARSTGMDRPCCTDRCGWALGEHRRHNRLDKAPGVAHEDRAGVGRGRDHGHRRMALALAVGEVTAWAFGPAEQASQARCV